MRAYVVITFTEYDDCIRAFGHYSYHENESFHSSFVTFYIVRFVFQQIGIALFISYRLKGSIGTGQVHFRNLG